ncbi:MAG: hypothetical protein HQK49_14140 [Oligoflexia bacterium]|nr:hypothetical protein [Oligoflexia bacterium]
MQSKVKNIFKQTTTIMATATIVISIVTSALASEEVKIENPTVIENSILPKDYSKNNPYYYKFCATSRFTPKTGSPGVPSGHTVAFIHGACVDQVPNQLPVLRACRDGEKDLNDPESGVGISTDGSFKNTVFSAIPGLTPFMSGGFMGEEFNESSKKKMLSDYAQKGYFDGIELNVTWFTPELQKQYNEIEARVNGAKTEEERKKAFEERNIFVGDWMLGTEFALRQSRYLYCVNIPLTKTMMDKVIAHLNNLNKELDDSKGERWRGKWKPANDYIWDAIYNNCDHTGRNTFSATGAVKPIPVDLPLIRQLAHLAFPGRSYLDIAKATLKEDINVNHLYKNKKHYDAVMKDGWIPLHHESMLELVPFYNNNTLFEDTAKTSSTGEPFMVAKALNMIFAKFVPSTAQIALKLDSKSKKIAKTSHNKVFGPENDESALLEHYNFFKMKYYKAIKNLLSAKKSIWYKWGKKDSSYVQFVDKYEEILNAQFSDLLQKISNLESKIKIQKK